MSTSTPADQSSNASHMDHHHHSKLNLTDFYNDRAKNYEKGSGGVTRSVATHIVKTHLADLPPNARVLDNACGPAIVADELLKIQPTASIDAVDVSEGMINVVKGLILAQGWEGKVRTDLMNGCDLRFPDQVFDASVTNFGIFMFEPATKGASEIYRTLKDGGVAVVTTWKRVGWRPLLAEIEKVIRPGKESFNMPSLEKWSRKETLEDVMKSGGFQDVQVSEFETAICRLKGEEEDFAKGMAQMITGIIGEQWTEEEKQKLQGEMETVIADKERRDRLFIEKDGVFGLEMIAFVGVGTK